MTTLRPQSIVHASQAAAIKQSGWPEELFSDTSKQPVVLETAEAFIDAMMFGEHMNRVVVLKEGIKKLGMADALPKGMVEAAHEENNALSWLGKLHGDFKAKADARVYYFRKQEARRNEREMTRHPKTDKRLRSLQEKEIALKLREDITSPYLTELRYKKKYKHATDEIDYKVKTVLTFDMKDRLGDLAKFLPYIDRIDEGVFVGGAFTGSCVHVDQVQWSNIGKNFSGYKVFAIWKHGKEAYDILDKYHQRLFIPPLSNSEIKTLRQATTVALLGPGICESKSPSPRGISRNK
mmetsp:Transcript_17198/g.27481  ORF Transcript_17198/g.27481 Transcript_17198/m.27481 type:complete len:294 (-) Transcript_17198:520-1401(-)